MLFPPLLPKIVDKSIFGIFFKYRQIGMPSLLMEHLVDCYQNEGAFSLTRRDQDESK